MICEQLKALRDAAGLTNAKWAELSGVSTPTITRYLSDPNCNPQYFHVEALVKAAGGSIDILAGIDAEAVKVAEGYTPDTGAMYRSVIREERKEKRIVAIALALVVGILIGMFIYDFSHPDRGWVQYDTSYAATDFEA